MNTYQSFCATAAGISHSKHGKECQDYSTHFSDNVMSIAVVADGHGEDNCFRSAKGAEFAVNCAKDSIHEFINSINKGNFDTDMDSLLAKALSKVKTFTKSEKELPDKNKFEHLLREYLVKSIVSSWYIKVVNDYTKYPFTEAELEPVSEKYKQRYTDGEQLHHAYGATLIAAAITEDYWFAIHIGDGRLTALYGDCTFDQPVPWDERCYLNVTTSICDDDAKETARIYYAPKTERELPLAVFLCSDGVDDNYPVDENEKHLYKLYNTIAQTFAEDGFDSTSEQIKDLANSFATKGKGDDTSIAGLICMKALKDARNK